MGLDSVEILMRVEETFGISIPDREAEKIITVGAFHNSVWKHLEGKHSEKCKSQSLFYTLRQSFLSSFDLSKNDVKLDSKINDIIPVVNRRYLYYSFATNNNIKLPDLELTKPWSVFLISFGLTSIVGGTALSAILIYFFAYTKWTLLIPLAGIFATNLVSKALHPKRTIINPPTIRDFTKKVLSINYATIAQSQGTNRKEVESVINHIIADMAGVDLEEVIPDAKICDDLGID